MPVKAAIISLILLVQSTLNAQSDHAQLIASGISRYRAFLLESRLYDRQQLGAVLKKLERLNIPEEERRNFASILGFLSRPENHIDPTSLWYLQEKAHDKPYLDSLTNGELVVLMQNADLYDIINIGVLELEYPNKVKSDFSLYKELLFYDIQSGEQIGEVGAGNGEFSIILAMIYDSLQLYVNEITPYQISYIEGKFQRLKDVTRAEHVEIVVGEQYQTNFNSSSFDKIIIRNALHHFLEKKRMIDSIKAELSDDGFLFIYETTIELSGVHQCPYALPERKIIRMITSSGFELIDQMQVGNAEIYKFRKAPQKKAK